MASAAPAEGATAASGRGDERGEAGDSLQIETDVPAATRYRDYVPVHDLVAKGWITLRWKTEFEHHGPFVLGERDPGFIRERLRERQTRWDEVNALWMVNYPQALRFYRELREAAPGAMSVFGLIEDGMFEDTIQPSAALLGETNRPRRRRGQRSLNRAQRPWGRRRGAVRTPQ